MTPKRDLLGVSRRGCCPACVVLWEGDTLLLYETQEITAIILLSSQIHQKCAEVNRLLIFWCKAYMWAGKRMCEIEEK